MSRTNTKGGGSAGNGSRSAFDSTMTTIKPIAKHFICLLVFSSALTAYLGGQTVVTESMSAVADLAQASPVPLVVKFNAVVRELDGSFASGSQSITFALYPLQTGGNPLWSETQVVLPDSQGRLGVLLGSVSSLGVPASVFANGGPRWVGVTPNDGIERARIELVSVPYALKAADADTLGGKRSDEFVSVQQFGTILSGLNPAYSWLPIHGLPLPSPFGQLPVYEATTLIGPSFISVATGGPPLQVVSEVLVPHLNVDLLHGLSDAAFAKLNANNNFSGMQSLSGGIDLPASNPDANTQGGLDSAPIDLESSFLDPQTKSQVKQVFRWVSQPIPVTNSGSSVQLSLLFGSGGALPTSIGLSINADGTINFAPGQQLPIGVVTGLGTGGNTTNSGSSTAPIVNTANYPWTQTPPPSTAIQVGPNTVTLTPCPKGVNGTDLWHYLYISGTGTPEAVLITGGSCTSRATSGTIEFTAAYAHLKGYSIGTATAGVQEAVVDAILPTSTGQISRQVTIDPGSHLFRARLSLRGTGMTLTSSGATVTCSMSDTCIMMGDPANANMFASIVVTGLRIVPGVQNGTWPAVEDNANGSTVDGLAPAAGATGATFGSLIQIDNDQAATVNNLNTVTSYSWGRCDTVFCSTAIIGPGPFSKDAGVLWVQNSNITLQGVGNGIDNQNGNTLQVSNSVVQGYSQFGIRATTVYQPTTVRLNNVYFEDDSDANPLGTGSAGLIVEGGQAVSSGSYPAGIIPQFASTGNIQYLYYIVVNSTTAGTSPLYLAGSANTSGSGSIKVMWNQVGTEGVVSYDVLRIVGPVNSTPPYGTGLFAVATGVPATLCSNKVCSIIDNAASPAYSYTIHENGYWPSLSRWPGNVILTTPSDYVNQGGGVPTEYFTDSVSYGAIIASAGSSEPSVFAQQCNPQDFWTPIWMQCVGGNAVSNDNPAVVATLLQLGVAGGNAGGLKGRLMFELPGGTMGPTEVITLMDSNWAKTMATPNNRPSWDANDTYIGLDQPGAAASNMQLALGAPISVSEYVGSVPDGAHYLERLTASGKLFKVPLQVAQVSTGTVANIDTAGTLTIAGGTSSSYTFLGTYNSPLSCVLTPLADPTEIGTYWATTTNTTLTANVKVAGNMSFSYQCWSHDLYVQ
jgi:hypothetical protein